MAKHRIHSMEFKRQVAQEFIAGETLHGLAKRHDVSRNLIRIWVRKYEEGAFDGAAPHGCERAFLRSQMASPSSRRRRRRAPLPGRTALRGHSAQ
nr:transposase [Sinorhizobium sp. RAC02]